MSFDLFESAKKSRKFAILEVGKITIDEELFMINKFELKGFELIGIVQNKYYFRRKGLI